MQVKLEDNQLRLKLYLSIYETARYRVSVCSLYSSATSTNQSTRMDLMLWVISGCLDM